MDGTLVQARNAAWNVFQDTARKYGLQIDTAEKFFDLFRSNFFEALAAACRDAELAKQVREHFLAALRDRYTPHLIPGMADVIRALAAHYALAVISSNAMEAIRRTLEAAGVAQCFAHVFSGDVEPDKAASIRRILADASYAHVRRCSPEYTEDGHWDGEEVYLVTDTVGDVFEALSCGIRVIGVAWGMHSAEELRAAGAEFVALWPQELVARLLPEGSCSPEGCQCAMDACTTGHCTVASAPDGGTSSTAREGRDVRGEAAAAGSLRRARRATAEPGISSAHSCGGSCCARGLETTVTTGTATDRRTDHELVAALSAIAAASP
ncbi:HAD family hydrolase [Carbonactinospora thermoautotrophica]|nr:HAD hydrolase-like protein [Carbonactinospora thermoautotrophica]